MNQVAKAYGVTPAEHAELLARIRELPLGAQGRLKQAKAALLGIADGGIPDPTRPAELKRWQALQIQAGQFLREMLPGLEIGDDEEALRRLAAVFAYDPSEADSD